MKFPANWTPRPWQKIFLEDMLGVAGKPETAKKNAVLCWSRQMGKDSVCGIFMFMQALKVTGNYFYTFPYTIDARRAFWEKIEDHTGKRFLDQLPKELIKRRSDQEMSLELINGSIIRVLGFDSDPEQARGFSPNGVVFSEAAQMDPRVFSNMEPAIEMNNAWKVINSTPFDENHFDKMYKNAVISKDWHCSLVQTYYQNQEGFYYTKPQEYFTSVVNSGMMTQEQVEREYGCSWKAQVHGSIYGPQILQAYEQQRVGDFTYDPNYPVNTYWDIGDIDDTVIWFGQNIRGRTVFIDYFSCTQPNPSDIAMMLTEKGYHYGTHVLPWDARYTRMALSVEMQLSEAFSSFGVGGFLVCSERAGVQVGIQAVRRKFVNYYFNISKCSEGLELLDQYRRKWDDKSKRFLDEPIHNHPSSHTADALRVEALSENLTQDLSFGSVKPYKVVSSDGNEE